MITNHIQISIITLTINDKLKFIKTLRSIKEQLQKTNIEWLIIDGSIDKIQKYNESLINKEFNYKLSNNFLIRHINSNKLKLYGIYPCMNYAKKICKGKFIIYLNSGDELFNDRSLGKLLYYSKRANKELSLIFGQAKIIASDNLSWEFPGKPLKNIKLWLTFFEPNHQAMLISKKLAKKYNFSEKYDLIADGYWKRKIIQSSQDNIYLNFPISRFFLDGVSSIKPTKDKLYKIISNKNISLIRKFIFIVKFLIPKNLFFLYRYLQMIKSKIINFLF